MAYSKRISGLRSSAIREILKIAERPGIISFAGGLPAPDLFPLKDVAGSVQNLFLKHGPSVLQYSLTEGLGSLREKIARAIDHRGECVGPQNIIITQGSQQGLDLLAKLYLDEGTVVFTENPSYLGALQSFRLFQAVIKPISSDENGIRTDSLLKALQDERPAFVYLMPNFQNPTGISLCKERRKELVEIVTEQGLLVVEDDPYGELRFSGEKLPSLFGVGRTGNFVYLSSFSKTIAPGLRVAYMAAGEEIIRKVALIKQGTDLQTNTLGQYIVSEYLESGGYSEHIDLLRRTYAFRRDCMISAMEKYFPETATWNCPEGGMFLWVILSGKTDAGKVLPRCLERNVAFVPGQEFFADGSGKNTIRLNFSNASPEKIEEGVRRMGEVLRDMRT